MVKEDLSYLFREATKLEKKNDFAKAITVYKIILSSDPDNRRALFKKFNAAIEIRANDINEVLFERLIMLEEFSNEEKIIITKYYSQILKAYKLAELLLKEILETNPENKAANEEIAKVYLLMKKHDEAVEKYKFLREIHGEKIDYMYRLIDVYLKEPDSLDKVIELAKDVINNNGNILLAKIILEYAYTKLNMEKEKEETSKEISKYIFGSNDKVATIRTILRYDKLLSKGKNISDIHDVNYIKAMETKKGKFKNKKEAKKVKSTIQNKLNSSLIMQSHGYYIYCVQYLGAGSIIKSGKSQSLDHVIAIALAQPKNIIDIFPSVKLEKII